MEKVTWWFKAQGRGEAVQHRYIKFREVADSLQSCLFREGSARGTLGQMAPHRKNTEELSLSQWDFRHTHLHVQHEGHLHTAYTMQQHGGEEACQLLPGLRLIQRRNREHRPVTTSQQQKHIFLYKQNTPVWL